MSVRCVDGERDTNERKEKERKKKPKNKTEKGGDAIVREERMKQGEREGK